eukprot:6063603-Lingulodinium_polyedra.AAC.1
MRLRSPGGTTWKNFHCMPPGPCPLICRDAAIFRTCLSIRLAGARASASPGSITLRWKSVSNTCWAPFC